MVWPIGLVCKQQKCKHRQTLRLGLPESQAQKRAGTEAEHSRAVGPGAAWWALLWHPQPTAATSPSGLAVKVSTSPESFRDCLQIQSPQGHQPGSQPRWQGERKHLTGLCGPVGWMNSRAKEKIPPNGNSVGSRELPKRQRSTTVL